MNPLESFLQKFKNILSLQPQKKPVIVCLQTFGINLEENELELRNGIVFIKAHPLVRNEIFMRKSLILKTFQDSIALKALRDIK
jgi:hypothetical protein